MLNLVVALAAEAVPLVECFGLRPILAPSPFPLFIGDGLCLAVSGMGRTAAAGAVCWLAGREAAAAGHGWLNLGIAGSGARSPGTMVIATEVREAGSGRRWRMVTDGAALPGAVVVTVDRPESAYDEPVVYEMEASGFVAAALRFAPPGRVLCAKVISDGPGVPSAALDGAAVTGLIAGAMAETGALVRRLVESAGGPGAPGAGTAPGAGALFPPTFPGPELSVAQACRLQRLLHRARTRNLATTEALRGAPSAAEILAALEEMLRQPTAR